MHLIEACCSEDFNIQSLKLKKLGNWDETFCKKTWELSPLPWIWNLHYFHLNAQVYKIQVDVRVRADFACNIVSLLPQRNFFLDLMRYILCTDYVTVPFVYSYSQEQVCTQNKGKDATVFGEYRARHIVVQLVLEVILEVAETSVQNFWLITVTNGYKINFIIFFFKTPFLAPPSLVLSVAHY